MSNPIIQSSFNGGEWSPALNARVDMQRYHSAAALLRNFFVDYRGGATTRPGTKYVIQCISGTNAVRLISFRASLTVSYILVFENLKLYFINSGSPVLETAKTITGITAANPGVVTSNAHGFSNGDRVYISGVIGMTQVNNNYYIVAGAAANTFQLADLNGNLVDTSAYTAYSSAGTVARIYTIASPYASTELAQIKFAQDVNLMVLCHPNYAPYKLVLTSATSWVLTAITFGSTVSAPVGQAVATTLAAGATNYAYVITAIDATGQESAPSAFAVLAAMQDLRTTVGTNTITWTAVTGAASYNIYKAEVRINAAVPAGSMFGLIGTCNATTFIDSNISPDFSQGPPVVSNPFSGTGIQSVAVTNPGAYSNGQFIPTVSFVGGGGAGAAAQANASVITATIAAGGFFYSVGDTITYANGVVVRVTAVGGGGGSAVTGISVVSSGNIVSGLATGTNPATQVSTTALIGSGCTLNLTWGIATIGLTSPGTGYGPAPAVAFSSGAAAATATLGTASSGNPTVPSFHQQRLELMGPVSAPNQINASQPGTSAFFNFNVTNPVQADNAFQGTLNSGQLNTIQSAISQPQGLIVLSDTLAWLVNGGSAGSPFSAISLVANAQIFNGASALPPIIAVDDILYVQSKGSIVRDMIFNFQKQVYTGADISVQSSHLFFGYQILEWAYAEEPFKLIWAVRNDGSLLTLTFLREQELVAWTHSDTSGSFKSVASVTESSLLGNVDAVYTVVQRSINGNTVQYIERLADLYFPSGATDAWQVDAGLQYNGAAALTFSGAQHLAGASCTGLATDDQGNVTVIAAFVMPVNGTFTLAAPTAPATGFTRVTIGLAFTSQLQTLAVDLGAPTVQSKRKKVSAVTARVRQALGLSCGRTFATVQPMKDLVIGNVGTMSNEVVTDLVTSDARIIVDPQFDVFGQYCFQQSNPYPATILGVIPEIEIGDSPK